MCFNCVKPYALLLTEQSRLAKKQQHRVIKTLLQSYNWCFHNNYKVRTQPKMLDLHEILKYIYVHFGRSESCQFDFQSTGHD